MIYFQKAWTSLIISYFLINFVVDPIKIALFYGFCLWFSQIYLSIECDIRDKMSVNFLFLFLINNKRRKPSKTPNSKLQPKLALFEKQVF